MNQVELMEHMLSLPEPPNGQRFSVNHRIVPAVDLLVVQEPDHLEVHKLVQRLKQFGCQWKPLPVIKLWDERTPHRPTYVLVDDSQVNYAVAVKLLYTEWAEMPTEEARKSMQWEQVSCMLLNDKIYTGANTHDGYQDNIWCHEPASEWLAAAGYVNPLD